MNAQARHDKRAHILITDVALDVPQIIYVCFS